ncbi:MAG: choice-of-anchor tandem repeat GloVer-containing protein [Bryobacteraceae bacterium]
MRSSKAARGCVRARGAVVFASLLCSVSPSLMAQDPPPALAQPGSRKAWRESMVRTPLPKEGCFEASYPGTDWREVPCTTPPSYPLPRTRFGGNSPDTVGGGGSNDFVAQVTSGFISTAVGSFLSVTPGITETGIDPYTRLPTANAFTLQLNTNTFTVPTASSCSFKSHNAWQQFVFDNYSINTTSGSPPKPAQAYIQYWLLGYGTPCPTGWTPWLNSCFRNSHESVPIPVQTVADLAQLSVTGAAVSGGFDTVTFTTPDDNLYGMGADSVFCLSQAWQAAEFNIFGDDNSTEANFSSGSTIVVKVSVNNGTTDAPTGVEESFTGETDNLTLVPAAPLGYCPYGGASPNIQFMETNAASPTATCFSSGLQAFTTLASFNGTDGANPQAVLVQATNGDLYATTVQGGANGSFDGTVFKITPSGTLTPLYSFCSKSGCTDGANPLAGLVQAANGDFYGTTSNVFSGSGSLGTVFKITPGGTLTTLYSFCAQSGCTDGEFPYAGLVQATNGDFYGTTQGGGSNGNGGTVFRITPGGTLTTLHRFCAKSGCTDGEVPYAGLVQATDGDLYGTTLEGGSSSNGGTVFKITPSGTLTTLYSFCPQSGCMDGEAPYAGLVQAADGDLYGTTSDGGANGNGGTIFKITTSGTLTTLYSFCSQSECTDGAVPYAGLVQATDGDLYGTTYAGGTNDYGTIFRITPNGTLTTLYSFCSKNGCTDGYQPIGGLVQATNGSLYGTTINGALLSGGTVFSLSVGLEPFVETLPTSGSAGAAVKILGTTLTGTTSVTFDGTEAEFTVVSPSLITTTVPAGATTGTVQVVTPNGTLSSNVPFRVP